MTAQLGLKLRKSNVDFSHENTSDIAKSVRIAEMNGKYGLITDANSTVCPCDYDEIVEMGSGYYKMRLGSFWGVINAFGKVCCQCLYFNIIGLADGGMYCEMDDDVFYIKFA